MSRSAQYFQSKWAILLVSQERAASRPTRRPALLRRVSRHSTAAIEWRAPGRNRADLREKKTQMHREDLMNADTLSELLLLVCGSVIFVALLLILLAALTQTAALT
jgi:hypothetical protein